MTGKLDTYKLEFNKVFKFENDRAKAHEICAKLLENLTQDAALLKIVLMHNFSNKDFLCQGHYPVLAFPIFSNVDYELIANIWLPLQSKSTDYSTKQIHHHGPMLMTTVTSFGPGYFHYLFKKPERISPDTDLFSMKLLEAKQHRPSNSLFVDQYLAHVPMYPEKLSITFALWSDSKPTKFLSRIKKIPTLQKRADTLRKTMKSMGMGKALDLKLENYLDYHPSPNGFIGIKNRDEVEFKRGPIRDRVQSIIHLLQETSNEDLIDICQDNLESNKSMEHNEKLVCLKLMSRARKGEEIAPKISEKLHFGFEKANFTHEQIKASL